ncbi:MAG: hypothetical protein R1F52_00120 [Candidatus Nitrosoabyssus spongiisocia]|nr:MAG: hypothetical protein R1F52_00120 [Nitrosopumilaceae archaeon AB1(1)]
MTGFGLLLDLYNTGEPVYVEGSSLTLVSDKTDYTREEPITLLLINTGTVPLKFVNSYSIKVSGLVGIIQYESPKNDTTYTLEPREEFTFVWDQIRTDGNFITSGTYRVTSSATANDIALERSVIINIT